MKKDIHPTYYKDAKITCACGATFSIGSTLKKIKVELCSNCHPFYTGKQKLVDTARRVDKFKKRLEQKQEKAKTRTGKKAKKAKQKEIKAAKKVKAEVPEEEKTLNTKK